MPCGHGAKGIKTGWKGRRNKRICLRSCDMHKTETTANPYQKKYGSAVVWFIRLDLLVCHAHIPVTDSAQSSHSVQAVHTPTAYCTAASPALPSVLGYCRTRPPRRCSRWHGRAVCKPGFHPVGVHVVAAGKQFRHSRILQDLIFGVRSLKPMPSSRWGIG